MAPRAARGMLVLVALVTSTIVNARTLAETPKQFDNFGFEFEESRRYLAQDGTTAVFINEIHWDNQGLDYAEAVEIFGPAGKDISGYVLFRYANGGGACSSNDCAVGGAAYTFPTNPATIIPSYQGAGTSGTLVVVFPAEGLDNGGAAISLSDKTGQVLDFISYTSGGNGPTTAASAGPAKGLTPTPIPSTSAEVGTAAVGLSVQRTGPTTFNPPAANTMGPATYRSYYNSFNNPTYLPGGVPTCRLDQVTTDSLAGSIYYEANPPNPPYACTPADASTDYRVVQPAIDARLWSSGPRLIGAGQLPDATTVTNLRAGTTYLGTGDPHFDLTDLAGEEPFTFDFHGVGDRFYCLLADALIHLNVHMFSMPAGTTVLNQPEGGDFFDGTWMDRLGFVYLNGGKESSISVAMDQDLARAGQQSLSVFFGEENLDTLMVNGVSAKWTSPDGLATITRSADVSDYLLITIADRISMAVYMDSELEYAPPVYFVNFEIKSFAATPSVHGVIGQMLAPGAVEQRLAMGTLEGLLHREYVEGTDAEYETTSLTTPDCSFSRFGQIAQVVEAQQSNGRTVRSL